MSQSRHTAWIARSGHRSEQLAVGLLLGFGLALGLAVAPTLSDYVDADPRSVWLAGGATALFMAGFGAARLRDTTRPHAARAIVARGAARANRLRDGARVRRDPERRAHLFSGRSRDPPPSLRITTSNGYAAPRTFAPRPFSPRRCSSTFSTCFPCSHRSSAEASSTAHDFDISFHPWRMTTRGRSRSCAGKENTMTSTARRDRAIARSLIAAGLAALATGLALASAAAAHADSTPVGPPPAGPVSTITTTPNQLVAVALPHA